MFTNNNNDNKDNSNFQMNKVTTGEYNIKFYLENKNIQVDNIIDFHLIKLLYELNHDIYEKIDLNILNNNEAILLAINKHLFQDLGISQKYTHLTIKKNIIKEEGKIIFDLQPIKKYPREQSLSELIPEKAEQLPIEQFIILCNVVNEHKIEIEIDFKIDIDMIELPDFVENVLCKIFVKMFKRVKQFIENIQ
jgi:hypothetical protein